MIDRDLSKVLLIDNVLFDEGFFESCFIEITLKNEAKLITGEVYRVPNTNQDLFLERYQNIVDKVELEKKDLIIGTDQNLDFLKLEHHPNTAKFLDNNLSSGLLPTITKPTRITFSSATLIDNIYAKLKSSPKIQSGILLSKISDHLPCLLMIDEKPNKINKPIVTTYRKLDNVAIEKIRTELGGHSAADQVRSLEDPWHGVRDTTSELRRQGEYNHS